MAEHLLIRFGHGATAHYYEDTPSAERRRLALIAERLSHRLHNDEWAEDVAFIQNLVVRLGEPTGVRERRREERLENLRTIEQLRGRLVDACILLSEVSVLSQERADVARDKIREALGEGPSFGDIVNHDQFEVILAARMGRRRGLPRRIAARIGDVVGR